MGQTSRKLYNVKNNVLLKKVGKIDVKNSEELLLLEAPNEFDAIYRALDVKSKQDFVKKQTKDSRELKVFQDKYDNLEAFKGSHIKKLCNTYDLMILPVSEVKGYYNDATILAIKEFTVKFENTTLSDSSLYILTHRECFYNDFDGKEVKTFIIFYKDKDNDSTGSYRKVHKKDVVNQVYASGNDFNSLRVFNQLFLKRTYTNSDGATPRIWGNLLILILLMPTIAFAIAGHMIASTVFLAIYLGVMWAWNTSEDYRDCWNEHSTNH